MKNDKLKALELIRRPTRIMTRDWATRTGFLESRYNFSDRYLNL